MTAMNLFERWWVMSTHEENICPMCKDKEAFHIHGYDQRDLIFHNEFVSYPIRCRGCGWKGHQTYKLTFASFEDEMGEPIA